MRGCVASVAVALSLLLPAAAGAASVSSFSVFSDEGDFIGQGVDRVVHPGNARHLGARMDGGALAAGAQRHDDESFGVEMAAPPGESLRPFNFMAARRYPFNDGAPGLRMTGGSRACNELEARFEILDVALNADGTAKRLWALYESHCEFDESATWGEIRINAWVPDAAASVAPGIVRWPELDTWETANAVPVTYLGSSAVSSVAIAGASPGDFTITGDGCSGRAGPCDVTVRATPASAGAKDATLRITDTAGRVHEAALQAFRHGGATDADLEVLPGDAAGTPGRYRFSPADATFSGSSTMPRNAGLALRPNGSNRFWIARLYAGMNGTLAPGAYPDGRGDTFGPEPGVDVDGPETGCNRSAGSFTIHSMSHVPDGSLRSLDVSVENGCYEDERPALRGRWRFRAGANEPLAPWMSPGPRPGVQVPPDAPDTPVAAPPAAAGGGLPGAPAPSPAEAARTALAAELLRDSRTLRGVCSSRVERTARLLRGTARSERLLGRSGADLILAGPGRDTVLARAGSDCVAGGAGNDRLEGGAGADTLLGQGGDDVLVGGPGRDLLDCGPGRRDRAITGRGDRTRGCERVSRPRPRRRR